MHYSEKITILDADSNFLSSLQGELRSNKSEFICSIISKQLPFKNDSFDLIAIDSVKDVNSLFIDELKRILKPEGVLFQILENRFGRVDSDSKKNLLLKGLKLSQRESKNALSLKECEKLYKNSGFDNLSIYGIEPDSKNPKRFSELNKGEPIVLAENREGLKKFLPNFIFSNTIPEFVLAASEKNSVKPLYQEFIEELEKVENKAKGSYRFAGSHITAKGKLIIKLLDLNSREHSLIKIPLDKEATKACRINLEGLEILKDSNTSLSVYTPSDFGSHTYENHQFYSEKAVRGDSAADLIDEIRFSDITESLIKVFQDFQIINPHNKFDYKKTEIESWHKKIAYIEEHPQIKENNLSDKLTEIKLIIEREINNSSRPPIFRKNDFSLSNVFLEDNRISGLIDFDEFTYSHFYLLDFCDFIYSYLRYKHNLYWQKTVPLLYKGLYGDFREDFKFGKNVKSLDCTIDDLKIAFLLSWIDHVYNSMLQDSVNTDEKRVNSLLIQPLIAINL